MPGGFLNSVASINILDQGEWIKLLTAKLDREDTWDPPCGRRVLTAKAVHRSPNMVGVYVCVCAHA